MKTDESMFDAIVIGSGITGGWAAKELTERGLKVLMIERGRKVEHGADYVTETKAPWEMPYRGEGSAASFSRPYGNPAFGPNEYNQHFFVKDADHPYQSAPGKPFSWTRGYQLGGRSLTWGKQAYRFSDIDFEANKKDGTAADWPIRYADLAPWYDKVEEFIGVSGSREGLDCLPDGRFQPPMAFNAGERHFKDSVEAAYPGRKVIMGRTATLTKELPGRAACQNRNICQRGCSFGAYFSTQSSTLPAAQATGRLTVVTDTQVTRLVADPSGKRIEAVETVHAETGAPARYTARLVFLCASAFNSVHILLNSASANHPNGLANGSGTLGRFIMDHCNAGVIADFDILQDTYYFGNKSNVLYVPRFKNLDERREKFLRGYGMQLIMVRRGWRRGLASDAIGVELKREMRKPGPWVLMGGVFAECLPVASNRITLDPHARDRHGIPQLRIDFEWSKNELALIEDGIVELTGMIKAAGGRPGPGSPPGLPGSGIHEMGGARMGNDPGNSVLNRWNQSHEISNLFVTDGSAMASSACQNPSLTYMALTARAAETATSMLAEGKL